MGLVGLLVTVAIMILGAGYLLWGVHPSSMTLQNQDVTVPADANTVAGAQGLINQAKDLNATLEKKAVETSQQITDNNQQGTVDSQQPINSSQQKTDVTSAHNLKIINRWVNFGFERANRKAKDIDTIVLHSSYNNQGGDKYSVDAVIGIWKEYGVAPHYLVDREGHVYHLVEEKNRAYHAGESEMKDGRTNVNDFSIGIEILNTKEDEYTDAEYQAINGLVAYLKERYPIKYVVGHDDIAPGRKTDPWNFEWKRIR